jgi:hypothetical protein
MRNVQNRQIHRDREKISGCGVRRGRDGELSGYRVFNF